MMNNSPFKKTFYFGLSLFLSPVIVTGVIILLTILNSTPKPKKVQVIKEVVFPPENVVDHDTVYIERPKPKITPKVTPKVVEPIKTDTVKFVDTSTQTN